MSKKNVVSFSEKKPNKATPPVIDVSRQMVIFGSRATDKGLQPNTLYRVTALLKGVGIDDKHTGILQFNGLSNPVKVVETDDKGNLDVELNYEIPYQWYVESMEPLFKTVMVMYQVDPAGLDRA